MATHSSIPAWEIPWTEEPGGCSPWGCKRVRHILVTQQQQSEDRISDVTRDIVFQGFKKKKKINIYIQSLWPGHLGKEPCL